MRRTSACSANRHLLGLVPFWLLGLVAFLGIGVSAANAAAPTFSGVTMARTTQAEAQLNARINPQESAITECRFDYGLTESYGQSAPCLASTLSETSFLGSTGTTILPAAASLSGLSTATAYHFRLVVENADGAAVSSDQTFTTARTPDRCAICVGVDGERRIELVTTGDKNRNPVAFARLSSDGDRVLYEIGNGAPDSTFGSLSWHIASRTPEGWLNRNTLPPNDGSLPAGSQYGNPHVIKGDLSEWVTGAWSSVFGQPPSPVTLVRLHDDATQQVLHTFPSVHEIEISESPAVAASQDLAHVFYNTGQSFDPGHVPGTANVYDFGASPPQLVSRLPDDSIPVCGVPVSSGANSGFSQSELRSDASQNWVSVDGSVIFFQAVPGAGCSGARQLYRRDLTSGATTLISGPVVAGTDTGLARPGLIQAASDGSWVIYKSRSRLDAADTNTTPDIYRWEAATEANACLTCVLPGPATAANVPNDPSSAIASTDGSHVYFRSPNQLTQDAPGGMNLYLWSSEGGGTLRFVAPKGASGLDLGVGGGAGLTDSGSVLVFTSNGGGVPVTADSDPAVDEYYRFDADNRSLICISCSAEPVGPVDDNLTPLSHMSVSSQHALSSDGDRFVFETSNALVSADVNGGGDVYEWRDGRVGLLTRGREPQAGQVGAISQDAAGRDVIFAAPGDSAYGAPDGSLQVYDARLGGGFPEPATPPPPCTGEACQGPPAPAPRGGPSGTAAFSGPGNAKPHRTRRCRKGMRRVERRGKARCVRRHHRGGTR